MAQRAIPGRRKILLIYPKFPRTFWGMQYAIEVLGRKATMPPLGLLTVAAMCPPEFELRLIDHNCASVTDEAIEWADVLNVLRLQLERMKGGFVPSLREYNRVFGVTSARLNAESRDILILHPGPMNRGVEIDSDVADGPHSVILRQVTNGVAVRMAVLYLLAGGEPEQAEAAKGPSPGREAST